jgi:hypothetical protein
MRFALIAFLSDEPRDSRALSAAVAPVAERPLWTKNAPAAGGWGASQAAEAGLDFGVTPDQDPAILPIWVDWSLFNFDHPVAIGGDEVPPINQAVWPSNSPVLGIFFACCGVIFAVS